MAANTFSVAPSNSTATLYRAWVGALRGALLACGWTQTSDTGQMDVSSLTVPTAIQTSSGYMVFAMADDLQATNPVYMRIDVGSGNAVNSPSIWVQVGTATDGAGTLSGKTTTQRQLVPYSSDSSTTASASFYSGSTSRFVCVFWVGGTTNSGGHYGQLISVERTHDASGSDTADGVMVFTSSFTGSTNVFSQYLSYSAATQPPAYQHWNCALPTTGTGAANNNVYLYPVRGWGFGETGPSLNLLMYFTADLVSQNSVTATLWPGSSGTILPLGYEINGNFGYGGAGGTPCVALRYD